MTARQKSRRLTRGLYRLDDLKIGDVIETPQRLITALDIDQFAVLSGDYFAIHMNEDAARASGFSGRVAHGLLVLSIIDGLKNQADAQLDAIASLGWDMGFSAPVFVGDRLSARLTIIDIRPTSDGKRGIATIEVIAGNQHDEVVQKGVNTLMLHR